MMRFRAVCSLLLLAGVVRAADEMTVYDLLAPATRSFAITYDTSTSRAGATALFNVIRTGAEVSAIRVVDRSTGKELAWKLVTGEQARAHPFGPVNAAAQARYIMAQLARPAARGGESRVRIFKTYKDPASYRESGDQIVFERSFSIRRNAIVLPAGYRLASCSAPAMVSTVDGRVRVSVVNDRDDAMLVRVIASRGAAGAATAHRAEEDREITYWLLEPETHRFRIAHEFTVSRPGQKHVHNFVRQGSTVSDAVMTNLDTGAELRTSHVRGREVNALGYYPEPVADDAVVVQGDLEKPLAAGESVRLRVTEVYTDAAGYGLREGELFWDRTLGRPRNQVVLPKGWMLVAASPGAIVSRDADGRIVCRFANPRSDSLAVSLRARRLP